MSQLKAPQLKVSQFVKKILPQSLFGRSLIILVTPLILVQFVLGYIFFDRHTETILRLLSSTISGDIAFVLDSVEREDSFPHIRKLAERDLSLSIKLSPHEVLEQTGIHRQTWLYTYLDSALKEKIKQPYYVRMDSNFINIHIASTKGVLKVQLSRKRLFSRTTPLVIIWTTVSALLLFIVASIFMRNQIRPIRRLAEAADRFGKGDDTVVFNPEGATEVRKAGVAFQLMRDRLRRQLSERLEMLAGVSHDLRTPLARIKLQLAMMTPTEETKSLQEDVVQMQGMVEGFLIYARGTDAERSQPVLLYPFLQKIIRVHQTDQLSVFLNCHDDIKIFLKSHLFNRSLTNLLLNSKRYARKVIIDVCEKKNHILLTIDDDGPGIAVSERENVFRPFYRVDASRNLEDGGVGLGLSIAKDAVQSHGGRIYLGESPLGGLRVTIRLPR
ncbi:MAG: ATP-binding protein [Alphaproteobacteria bacterium]|nr:ATP-binding protein [Alphaproteobacteria bacterium]